MGKMSFRINKMNIILILLIVIAYMSSLDDSVTEAKRSMCKEKINKNTNDFFYCTKFAVGKGQAFKS